jgi:DNA-binding LacI/PurR family transcriptional regulator
MHVLLASQGVRWEEISDARLAGEHPENRLKELVAARPRVCWILIGASERIQRWIAAAGVPALILGSCAPTLGLPHVDVDYGATGWHAAGMMLTHGHSAVGLVLPPEPLPGDLACRDSFCRYIGLRAKSIKVIEVTLTASTDQFKRAIARLFAGDRRPTAVLSMRPAGTIALIMTALELGLRIPRDISIISRDTHSMLEAALPDLTRYRNSPMKRATRAFNIARNLLAGRPVTNKQILLTPTFVRGSTLGPAP